MCSLESQSFVKSMRICAGLVRGQLNDVCIAIFCPLNCPLHHFASNSLVLMMCVYAHGFYLRTQSTLKAERWKKHEMKRTDHLPIQFSHDQLMIPIFINQLKG